MSSSTQKDAAGEIKASVTEGKLPFTYQGETYETYYKIVGDTSSGGTPLVTLHGGPGSTHHYLLALSDLAAVPPSTAIGTSAVIFYDQLGNGGSTHLREKPASFWTPELFMEELANLVVGLGTDGKYDLLGHSWGGMLAAQFVATYASSGSASSKPGVLKGLRKLVLASSPASMALFEAGCAKLVQTLPQDVQDTLRKHEENGTTNEKEYQDAVGVFYERHLCRVKPFPEDFMKSFEAMEGDPTVYHTMNGPSEFHITGTLRPWSIILHIPSIKVPTLLTTGAHDEVQEEAVQPYWDGIAGKKVKWAVFAESSHMPHLEERERFVRVVGAFLASE